MKKLLVFLLLITQICCFSQQIAFPKIVPPSPTAYELGKYGQIPVGMFTGTPNVSVPLYTYNTRNLSVPISLSYSSNGIKVDQLSSNVGLGWNLNAGGAIIRIARDKMDEERGVLMPENVLQEYGYNTPEAMAFFQAAGEDDADTETDLYMYNFMGHSGKFVFNNKKSSEPGVKRGIIMMPQTDMKVEVLATGFKITSSDGIQYFFQEEEITNSKTEGLGPQLPVIGTTAWYLTKIQHPKGDYVEFIYDTSYTLNYLTNITESATKMVPKIQTNCNGTVIGGSADIQTISNRAIISSKQLSKIKSNKVENGEILIESNISHPEISSFKMISKITVKDKDLMVKEKIDLTYYPTQNDRMLLNGVQYLDPDKNYSFEYYHADDMPARLSKGVDHYGYYNGKNNIHRYPDPMDPIIKQYLHPDLWEIPDGADKSVDPSKAIYGLLKKVHYPTKGYNEFEYEANSYYGNVDHYPTREHLYAQVLSDEEEWRVEDEFITQQIGYTQDVDVIFFIGPTPCHDGQMPNAAIITISDDLNNTLYSEARQAGSYQYTFTFYEGRVYTLKIKTVRPCTRGDLNLYYYPGNITTTTENIPVGGLRIKRVESFDSENSVNPNSIMRYYYGSKDALTISTGQQGSKPFYLTRSTTRDDCPPFSYFITYQSLNSNSMRQLYSSSDVGTTSYQFVTVSYGGDNFEGGGIENEYFIMPDVQGNPLRGNPIDGTPWVNSGWKNGLLKKESIFKVDESENPVLLKTTSNSYIKEDDLFDLVYGYSVVKKYHSSGLNVNHTCTEDDVQSFSLYKYCATDHSHHWWLPSGNCIAPGHDNRTMRYDHPCYGLDPDTVISFPDRIENLDVMEYSSNSYWFYQDSQTITEYDESGNPKAVTTTQYYYDNPEHLQPTRIVTTRTGDNKIIITKTDYPDDLLGDPYMSNLGSDGQYRISEPIRVRTYQKKGTDPEELLSTQKTVYDNFGNLYLPKLMQTAKGAEPLQNRLVYSAYDGNGNLREIYQPNGSRTVYVMGYNFTLPVAKLENVSISEINQNWLNAIYDATNESSLLTALNNLRTNLANINKSAQITTLTHIPLVGVHTITDPKGYRMVYEYDDFGRLKYVKDMDENILSENQYHYIND